MKQCFKCGEAKELSEFYKHSRMADGHLNKCKTCTKKDAAKRLSIVIQDPEWRVKERRRIRARDAANIAKGIVKPIYPKKAKTDPIKRAARLLVQNAVKANRISKMNCFCGASRTVQAHHEDYSKPLDVVWLCKRHHSDRHNYLGECEILSETPLEINQWINEFSLAKLDSRADPL